VTSLRRAVRENAAEEQMHDAIARLIEYASVDER
jgi:hypothetical protein